MNGPGFGEQATEAGAGRAGSAAPPPRPRQPDDRLARPAGVLVQRAGAPGASFHLVVPATRISDQQEALVASEHLRSIGLEVSGDVGDPDPCVAVRDALGGYDSSRLPDEIIVSTLPARLSRWVVSGLVRRVRRECPVPVTHAAARPTFLAALRGGRRPEPVA